MLNTSLTTSLIRGPALILWQGQTFWSMDDISVSISGKTIPLADDSAGVLDETEDEVQAELTFSPSGEISASLLAVLFPFFQGGWQVGHSLFAADSALVIYAKDGTKYTFPSAYITRQPSLHLGLPQHIFGPITFTCLRPSGTPWSSTGSLWSSHAATYPGNSLFQYTNLLSGTVQASFASSLGTFQFYSNDGFIIESHIVLEPVISDGSGLIDLRFQSLLVTCACTPILPATSTANLGPSPAAIDAIFNIQGTGSIRGSSRFATSGALKINSNGLYLKMPSASVSKQVFRFGTEPRSGGVVFNQAQNLTIISSAPL